MAELRETLQRFNADTGVQINGGTVTINNFGTSGRPGTPETPESGSSTDTGTPDSSGSSESGSSTTTGTPASPEQVVAVDFGLAPMRAQGRKSDWGGKVGLACRDNSNVSVPVIATVRSCPANLLVWAAVKTADSEWYGLYPKATDKRGSARDFLFCIDMSLWAKAEALLFVAKGDDGDAVNKSWQTHADVWGKLYGDGMLINPAWSDFAIDREKEIALLKDMTGVNEWDSKLGLGIPAFYTVAITLSAK